MNDTYLSRQTISSKLDTIDKSADVCLRSTTSTIKGIPTNFHLLIFMKGNYQELTIMSAS